MFTGAFPGRFLIWVIASGCGSPDRSDGEILFERMALAFDPRCGIGRAGHGFVDLAVRKPAGQHHALTPVRPAIPDQQNLFYTVFIF
jgi:hypothetical protein